MGIDPALSPSLVRRVLEEEERPLRCQTLAPEVVQAVLRYGAPIGTVIERHARLHRGMEHARELIRQTEERGASFPTGTVILAEELTGGKGRFQRGWHAPRGGLWLTLVLVNTLLPEQTHLYPLAAGLACCEAVRHYGIDARLKWVNDVLVSGRKLVGVLTETVVGPRYGEQYILIGVGLNVNNLEFPSELSSLAVSMRSLLGEEVDFDLLAARLLAKFVWNIGLLHYEEHLLLQEGELSDGTSGSPLLLDRWQQLSDSLGRRVRFGYDVQLQPQYEAEVVGLDPSGGLLLRLLPDGNTTVCERSGEILYLD